MEALIDSGEEWMTPLLELRDFLAETQKPENKRKYRSLRRRDGRVWMNQAGTRHVPGPYTLTARREILRRVLDAQVQLRANGPDPQVSLISLEELREIRRIWRMEEQDWEDSLPRIVAESTGVELDWPTDDMGSFSGDDFGVLESVCQDLDVPAQMVAKLLDTERQLQGMGRRSNIYDRVTRILNEDWLTSRDARELTAKIAVEVSSDASEDDHA